MRSSLNYQVQISSSHCNFLRRLRLGLPQRARKTPLSSNALHAGAFKGLGLSEDDAARVATVVVDDELVISNLTFLTSKYKPYLVAKLVQRQPELLSARLEEWHQFLTGYGLSDEAVWRLLRHCPRLMLSPADGAAAGGDGGGIQHNTPYNAGAAIVWLKGFGWSDEDIASRVLPCYPEVLAASPERLQASVDFLRSRNFDEDAVRRMVLTFPPLLVSPYQDGLFQLIDRIRASAHNKYVISGSYHV